MRPIALIHSEHALSRREDARPQVVRRRRCGSARSGPEVRAGRAIAALTAVLALAAPSAGTEAALGITEAVEQALASNGDLASRRRALEADREQVGIARSALLPQLSVGGSVQALDSERSDGDRGTSTEEAVTFKAQATQVLYDEDAWAGYQSQQHTFEQQQAQYESFRLGIAQEAAVAFLALDRSLIELRVQRENRELTAQNLETTEARVATGYSSERELLRWRVQLAQNDLDVERAQAAMLANRFELNRVRSRPPEEPVEPVPSTVEGLGFLYARDEIVRKLEGPEADRKLRDVLAVVGIGRAPDLRALDAAIAAQKRVLTATKRAFWVPSLSLVGGANHLEDLGSSSLDFEKTEWGIAAQLVFPLFEGGAKPASYRQARELHASLRLQRQAAAESLEQAIRSSFAAASGGYRSLGHAREQETNARKNFELVYQAYVLGAADYLDVLDAQSQLLTAQLTTVGALYEFLGQLIDAETQLAFFPFLEDPAAVEQLLQRLERELAQP